MKTLVAVKLNPKVKTPEMFQFPTRKDAQGFIKELVKRFPHAQYIQQIPKRKKK